MLDTTERQAFPEINKANNAESQPDQLSLGLVAPIENYATSAVPSMDREL